MSRKTTGVNRRLRRLGGLAVYRNRGNKGDEEGESNIEGTQGRDPTPSSYQSVEPNTLGLKTLQGS